MIDSLKNRGLASWLAPAALVGVMIILAGVVAYHAIDSWYLQKANASRLRADYAQIAAIRFNQYADRAIREEKFKNIRTDYASLFAAIFRDRRLLPSGIPAGGDNAGTFVIQVTAPDGRVVFRSGGLNEGDYVARDTLAEELGGMVTAVSARRSASAWLATEALAWRMSLILWLVGISAVFSIVVVRLMARETRLIRARTGFVSSVSHELRTPLAQIQIFLETLRLGRFTTEAERAWIFEGMQREITRLTTLVNNVLQFSRIERGGRHSIVPAQQLDLKPFLEEVIASFAPLAAIRSTTIETSLVDGLFVSISQDQLRQAVLNLLDNAVKYGPRDQTVRVSTVRNAEYCSIIVDDQGHGVPEAERTKVWQAFRRGSNVVDTVTVGSGIGLAVVREIVVAYGGRVSITDAPGGGGRFILDLR